MSSRFAVPILVLLAVCFWAVAPSSGCDRFAVSAQEVFVPQTVVLSAVPQVAVQAFAVPQATAVVANSHCFVPGAVAVQSFGAQAFKVNSFGGGASAAASAGGGGASAASSGGFRGRSRARSSSGGLFGLGFFGPNRSRAVSVGR